MAIATAGGFPSAQCNECTEKEELMTCLVCGVVCCGRYVRGHMVAHGEHTGHALVMGCLDLSVWCYKCDAYIDSTHEGLRAITAACSAAAAERDQMKVSKL